ncbi:MAG: SufD family Fe-S cluster assembly protein, partial [Candidatus Nanoarchaeia archaeon]|nr:SufD family Fe-S cluster assembly protein [Candidatus Nanoarchaeia archaeon]
MSDYDDLIKIADLHSESKDNKVAKLVISNNEIVGGNNIEGIEVKTDAAEEHINIDITVKKGYVIEKPVHMCFGILKKEFNQKIKLDIKIEDNAEVDIVGHCVFPNAVKVKHFMDAKIKVGENSKYSYFEKHIHSDTGGVEVYPKAAVEVGKNSRFNTEFELLKGRV